MEKSENVELKIILYCSLALQHEKGTIPKIAPYFPFPKRCIAGAISLR